MENNTLIEFKGLGLQYPSNDFFTLKELDLKINDGEFIVVVGPSGCGKSTTLKVLSGLEEITTGELYIDGRMVNYLEPKDRDIAMVFQNYALYPHFNVKKNITFGLSNMKVSKDEIATRLAEVSEMLQITDQLEKMPKDLSGGQQQRVALARAIIRQPLVYIFDEPLSNLDAKLRNKTRDEIVNMHKRLKKTFFYVTHDQVEAMTMADRIIVLNDGIVQQFDRPINIFYNPKNLFVAKFLGTPEMNTYELETKDGSVLFGNGVSLKLDANNARHIETRNKIHFGVRPDDIEYSFEQTEGSYEVSVEGREILGNTTLIKGEISGTDIMIEFMMKTKEYTESLEKMYITIDPKVCYYFDYESELNLNG